MDRKSRNEFFKKKIRVASDDNIYKINNMSFVTKNKKGWVRHRIFKPIEVRKDFNSLYQALGACLSP